MSDSSETPDETTRHDDVTCLGCGCCCDDLIVRVSNGRFQSVDHACSLGERWLRGGEAPALPACLIDGQPVSLDAGLQRAAELLSRARSPLVYGLAETTVEAQRTAVSIADWLGATIDIPASARLGSAGLTFPDVGANRCTFGEVRHRADVVVFWGADPVADQPRHLDRASAFPVGRFLPGGRSDRTLIVVDVKPTATAQLADRVVLLRPGSDFEALWIIRGLLAGLPLNAKAVEAQTGVPLDEWLILVDLLRQARYGLFFYGPGLLHAPHRAWQLDALQLLTRALNDDVRRFACLPIGVPGNEMGAENVLTWRTGFPQAVNLSRGYPRFLPDEATAAATLERGEVDAALLILGDGGVDELSAAAQSALETLPLVVVSPVETAASRSARVVFHTAHAGLSAGGTVYRPDDVALPLRPPYPPQLWSDAEVLQRLERRLAAALHLAVEIG